MKDVNPVIEQIFESLEIDIVLLEDDWCRNPHVSAKIFIDKARELEGLFPSEQWEQFIESGELAIQQAINKKLSDGEKFMIEPYHDGWLIHIYERNGNKHHRTVGSHDLLSAIKKL